CLSLVDRGVADTDRTRVRIPSKVIQLLLGQLAGAVEGIHDLYVLGSARDGTQQPVAPQHGLLAITGLQQRLDRQRGGAQPAVAVVPVARPTKLLRQGSSWSGHNASSAPVCQDPQDE